MECHRLAARAMEQSDHRRIGTEVIGAVPILEAAVCAQDCRRSLENIAEGARLEVSPHRAGVGMVEWDGFFPYPPQPLPFALAHRWIIDPADGAEGGAVVTSRAPLPVTSKTMEGAGLNIYAKRVITQPPIAEAAGHPLFHGPVRVDDDAAGAEVNHPV